MRRLRTANRVTERGTQPRGQDCFRKDQQAAQAANLRLPLEYDPSYTDSP